MITELTEKFRGRIAKRTGDGVLAIFENPADAVQFGMGLQDHVKRNMERLPPHLVVKHRVGMHLDEVLVAEEDCYGTGVNIAARVMQATAPGSVGLTGEVVQAVRDTLNIRAVSRGRQAFKGIGGLIELFVIGDPDEPVPLAPVQPSRTFDLATYETPQRAWWPMVLVLVLGLAAYFGWRERQFLADLVAKAQNSSASGKAAPKTGPAGNVQDDSPRPQGELTPTRGETTFNPSSQPARLTAAQRNEIAAKRREFFRTYDFVGFRSWLELQNFPTGTVDEYKQDAAELAELHEWVPQALAGLTEAQGISARVPIAGEMTDTKVFGDGAGPVAAIPDGEPVSISVDDWSPSTFSRIAGEVLERAGLGGVDRARRQRQLQLFNRLVR